MSLLQDAYIRTSLPTKCVLTRGEFAVEEDGSVYVYRKSGQRISDIRQAVKAAYVDGANHARRLTGRYPYYRSEIVL